MSESDQEMRFIKVLMSRGRDHKLCLLHCGLCKFGAGLWHAAHSKAARHSPLVLPEWVVY